MADTENGRKEPLPRGSYARIARRFKNALTGKPLSVQHVRAVDLEGRQGRSSLLAALERERSRLASVPASDDALARSA